MFVQLKKTILIDLDGVLNEYVGDFEPNLIPRVRIGAKEFLEEISQKFNIILFTNRNKLLASKWLIENGLDKYIIDVTGKKQLSWLFVDDRCVRFNGNYEVLKEEILNFKPWYK